MSYNPLKDLAEYKSLDNLKDVPKDVERVIEGYNHHRYQWGLNKMTPVQYRGHLLAA
ncbi:IS3 family transposase [Cytobacillus oceanisediminis]|uniref:IS3 family transposase n=1 Tax=Cytobacillus oceanisediminis TaxID=665099 RepID=UPI0037C01BB2